MAKTMSRWVPRPFALHWGSGQIVEEATWAGEHHEPAIQLLEFDDGSLSVRFCYFDHRGRFQRSPLMLGQADLSGLREAMNGTPRLQALLRELVGLACSKPQRHGDTEGL